MFSVTKQGAVHILAAELPLNHETCEDFDGTCEPVVQLNQPRILIDLSSVPYIDSAGLEQLLDVRDRCSQRGGSLKLAGPNPLCRDILRATGVCDEFEVFSSVIEGVGSFAR